MNNELFHPFSPQDQIEYNIIDALLTHLPALWCKHEDASLVDGKGTSVRDAWDALCGLGIGGLLVPVEHGGQGASLSRSLSAAWALSRLPAPVPFLSSAIAAPLFAIGIDERSLLSEIATGDTMVAIAFGGEARGAGEWGTTLHGRVFDVLHGADADRWIVAARTSDEKSTLLMVDRPQSIVDQDSGDPTRPTSGAYFVGEPARRLADGVEPLVVETIRRAHLVRCVEVLAAASVAAADDDAAARSISAAITAVRSAAAATDLHGHCDRAQLRLACSRTAAVSRFVTAQRDSSLMPASLRSRLCAHRASDESRWMPVAD
ncbi:MAG: hypothetical protein AB7I38_15540 [Dehalococcoidia bacterium]|uniref:hypothetical protein n=1 Tax=Pseudonocardia sp. TaxID=60912 RepID=UPI003D0FD5D0